MSDTPRPCDNCKLRKWYSVRYCQEIAGDKCPTHCGVYEKWKKEQGEDKNGR